MTLLEEIERLQRVFPYNDSSFGAACGNDKSFVAALRNGMTPRAKTEKRARDFIASKIARFRKEYPVE